MSTQLEKLIDDHAIVIRDTFEAVESGREHPDALSGLVDSSGEEEIEPGSCQFFYVLLAGEHSDELHLIVTVDTTDSGHIRITETKVRIYSGFPEVVERIVGPQSPYAELAVHMLEELGPVQH